MVSGAPVPVIAIDGPSGSGKTTVAACLARRLGVPWLSSGALYRAATHLLLERLGAEAPAAAVVALVRSVRWEVAGSAVSAAGRDLSAALHVAEVDRRVAQVSAIPGVRAAVNHVLRATAGRGRWVVEGRDIGTEVFPGAVLKVFLEAAPEVRAARRAGQRRAADARSGAPPGPAKVAQVAAALAERDRRDRRKPVGALRPAPDARRIDTSRLTVAEVCAKLCCIVPSNFLPE